MSGIAGIIHFDGKPVEPGLIEKMTGAMAHRGPDGINHWVKGSVALGQCMLRTTPESLEEHQPLTNEDESLVLVMDGRVDNRSDLLTALRRKASVSAASSDAELVLRAYEAWGEDTPDRIVGDFAFALWDVRKRKLFCSRDNMGVRPFYYYDGGTFLIFATEMHALFQDSRIPKQPNLGMIAEYLAAALVTRSETLFQRVARLTPGYNLIAKAGRTNTKSYWNPDFGRRLSYSCEEQYVEHFTDLLNVAVRSRLRCTGPIGVRMSGGLDSTTVYGAARALINSGEANAKIETFSTVFPGEDCDETDHINQMNAYWDTGGHLIKRWIAPPEHYIDHARTYLDCPDSPNGAMNHPLKAAVRSNDIRVLLTGCGGDEWFWGSDALYADMIKRLRLIDLARFVSAEDGTLGRKAKTLVRCGLLPFLPATVIHFARTILGRSADYRWLTPGLLRESSLKDRIAQSHTDTMHFASGDQEAVFRVSTNAWMASNAEIEDLTSARYSFEQRHPLWDRRIIEFALAIPGELRWRPPFHKHILREAARGLLPESLRLRRDKTLFNSVFPTAIERQGGESRMGSLLLASVGWVNTDETVKMTERVLSGKSSRPAPGWGAYIWPVWMTYSMDVWLRQSGLAPDAFA